jgi:hypothetical protein
MGQTIQQRQLKLLAGIHALEASKTKELGERIHPRKFNFSPKFAALLGAIIGYDYGVTDLQGNSVSSFSITSDGFIISSSNAFLGDAADLERNLADFYSYISADDAIAVASIQ